MRANEVAVVVTGFGPFHHCLKNPSWKVAQGLKVLGLGEGVTVYTCEIPVIYNTAKEIIVNIWETINPTFVIHLGAASGSRCILLEQTGSNNSYTQTGMCGACPVNHCCVDGGPDKLDSIVDMKALYKQLKKSGRKDILYSKDAGRYLCDHAYYCSLFHGQRRAAFVHLPAVGSLSSPDRLVPLLQTIIQTLLQQLDS